MPLVVTPMDFNECQLLCPRPTLYLRLASRSRRAVPFLFRIHYFPRFLPARIFRPRPAFVLLQPPRNVGRDASVERPVFALQNIYEIHLYTTQSIGLEYPELQACSFDDLL